MLQKLHHRLLVSKLFAIVFISNINFAYEVFLLQRFIYLQWDWRLWRFSLVTLYLSSMRMAIMRFFSCNALFIFNETGDYDVFLLLRFIYLQWDWRLWRFSLATLYLSSMRLAIMTFFSCNALFIFNETGDYAYFEIYIAQIFGCFMHGLLFFHDWFYSLGWFI